MRCELCDVGETVGTRYPSYWHLCTGCAKEVFVRSPNFYKDQSEAGWQKRV